MATELVEAAAEFLWAVGEVATDWLWGGHDGKTEQPRPVPKTLYEERRPPPDVGTRR